MTEALLARTVQLLTPATRYDVAAQDPSVSLRRIPARPREDFVVDRVRPAG